MTELVFEEIQAKLDVLLEEVGKVLHCQARHELDIARIQCLVDGTDPGQKPPPSFQKQREAVAAELVSGFNDLIKEGKL